MTGDFSRSTFNSRKHYSGVLIQQGRVDMDADWNEAVAIETAQGAAEMIDIVGEVGAPAPPAQNLPGAFQLALAGADLRITPGRLYVAGTPCQLDSPTVVRCQPVADQPTQVSVFTWLVDCLPFAVGQIVDVVDTSGHTTETTITAVDPVKQWLTLNTAITGAQSLSRVATYCFQPFVPAGNAPLGSPGPSLNYVAYLDTWQRVITALDDPSIADVALNGADSGVRTQTVWQVKLMPVLPQQSQPTNQQALSAWQTQLTASMTPRGQMSALVEAASATLLENQFYRVQIHCGSIPASTQAPTVVQASLGQQSNQIVVDNWTPDGASWDLGQTLVLTPTGGDASSSILAQVLDVNQAASTLTLDVGLTSGWSGAVQRTVSFKWARDNASHATTIVGVGTGTITIDNSSPRSADAFTAPGWIEVSTAARGLAALPGVMLYVNAVDGATLTVDYLPAEVDKTWTVQHWDGPYRTLDGLAPPHQDTTDDAGNVALEAGIAVSFSSNSIFLTGDYWNITARANTQAIDWPSDGGPVMQPPDGIQHQVAPLAVLTYAASAWTVSDTRATFGAMVNFLDRRGDTMTGPLLVDNAATTSVPPDPKTPYDVITSRSIYAGHVGASLTAPPTLPLETLPPQTAVAANGGVLAWNEQQANSFIYLMPSTSGNNPVAARAILQSTLISPGWQSPTLEIHDTVDISDPALVQIAVEQRQGPCELKIWSPKNTVQNFTLHIAGNLVVDGTYPKSDAAAVVAAPEHVAALTSERAADAINQARPIIFPDPAEPTLLRAAFDTASHPSLISTAPEQGIDLAATVAALTAVVQSQSGEITRLSALVGDLVSRVQSIEGDNP